MKILLKLFILTSSIQLPLSYTMGIPLVDRITIPDLFGFVAVIFSFPRIIMEIKEMNKFSNFCYATLLLIFSFAFTSIFSESRSNTLVEILIVVYLFCICILIVSYFKFSLLNELLPLIVYAGLISGMIGFYDIFASVIGLPRLFALRSSGEIIGGFRNAGQAGAFYLIILSLLIAIIMSPLYNHYDKKKKIFFKTSLILILVFFITTGKIAAYIGLLFGFVFLILFTRELKAFRILFFSILFFILSTISAKMLLPDVYDRMVMKVETRLLDKFETSQISVQHEDSFLSSNWSSAFVAFKENPLSGSGLGAFVPKYYDHEVHSTYLKMIGETGIIGSIAYFIFIIQVLNLFFINIKFKANLYTKYLYYLYPFFLGCMVSWIYTYHLRKREFWLMVAVIIIMNYRAKIFQNK